MPHAFLRTAALGATALAALAGCATRPPVPASAALGQPFVIEEALLGKTVGRGQFTSITGSDRGFTATLDGSWDGRTLTLVEDFVYDDGETDRKTWRLTKTGPGQYSGTREDVVGEARGYQDGDAFRLEYLIDLPLANGGSRRVGFRDVLVTLPNGDVLNEATVGWRGVRVGRVSLTITRAD